MELPGKTIRASEISTYVYCARAWWYRQQGIESENQADLATGDELHRRQGRAVFVSGCLRTTAYLLLMTALLLLTIALVQELVN